MKNLISLTPKSSVLYTLIFCFVCFLSVNEVKAQTLPDIYYPQMVNEAIAIFVLEQDLETLTSVYEGTDPNAPSYALIEKELLLNTDIYESIVSGRSIEEGLTSAFVDFYIQYPEMDEDVFVTITDEDFYQSYGNSHGDEVFDRIVDKLSQ